MSDEWSVIENPGGLSEQETLKRLTVEEKKQLAEPAIIEFPHLSSFLPDELERLEVDVSYSASDFDKVDALLDQVEETVRSGEDPEALDRYIYGQISEMNIAQATDADPDEVAARDPLDVWDGVYDE